MAKVDRLLRRKRRLTARLRASDDARINAAARTALRAQGVPAADITRERINRAIVDGLIDTRTVVRQATWTRAQLYRVDLLLERAGAFDA